MMLYVVESRTLSDGKILVIMQLRPAMKSFLITFVFLKWTCLARCTLPVYTSLAYYSTWCPSSCGINQRDRMYVETCRIANTVYTIKNSIPYNSKKSIC